MCDARNMTVTSHPVTQHRCFHLRTSLSLKAPWPRRALMSCDFSVSEKSFGSDLIESLGRILQNRVQLGVDPVLPADAECTFSEASTPMDMQNDR